MRVAQKTVRIGIMVGAVLFTASAGFGAFPGGIIVYAWNSNSGNTPPPSTSANLDGNENLSFGTNDVVTFSGTFNAGTYSVSVSTASAGYLLRQSPTDPNAVNDPYSDYGNPRYVNLSESTNYVPVNFQFDPVVTASAEVRDAWTMERLPGATIAFVFHGANGPVAVDKYPATASYASNWVSGAEGNFPTNTILYLHNYDVSITKSGYLPFYESNVITNAQPGDAVDMGTIYLEPVDNNSNQIADAWEADYFGTGSNVVADQDADGDGMSNRDEYIAGTNPTNRNSYLWQTAVPVTNGFELAWYVQPGRTYRVCGTTNLCTNTWVQVGGPWEATNGQVEMSWVETNMDLSWNSNYRIEVVPSWWQGTNQTLINTNYPYLDYGTNTWDGSNTNGPPLPGS